jgi:hypothetical protein
MRKQRAFASLTEQEYEQVGEWVCRETYDAVRDRVNKPRPEGFGLNISVSPLQTLHAKKNRLHNVNRRLKESPKLTLSELDAIAAGEITDVSQEAHDAIMESARDLALSGENSPAELLSLQRLADFPARADYREHKKQLELRKDQRATEMHTHKVQMEREIHTHKIEMAQHRQHIDHERIALAKRGYDLRERELTWKMDAAAAKPGKSNSSLATNHSPLEDDLGLLAATLDEVEARAEKKFGLPPGNSESRDSETSVTTVSTNPPIDPSPSTVESATHAPSEAQVYRRAEKNSEPPQCEIENAPLDSRQRTSQVGEPNRGGVGNAISMLNESSNSAPMLNGFTSPERPIVSAQSSDSHSDRTTALALALPRCYTNDPVSGWAPVVFFQGRTANLSWSNRRSGRRSRISL